MNKQRISVVIPIYNEELNIYQCLNSLQKQTTRPNAIYIVDNNSTDKSVAIARSFQNVEVINEKKQGICAAAKKGLDVAAINEGVIFRLDADCRPDITWIEQMITHFDDKSVVAVTGPGVAYDAGPLMKLLMSFGYMRPYFTLVGLALGRKPLFGSNFAIRANIWKRISSETHLKDYQNIHDDMDISFHLLGKGKTIYDSTITMPISSRPYRAPLGKIIQRYIIGFRSIFIHWPKQVPWKNWL